MIQPGRVRPHVFYPFRREIVGLIRHGFFAYRVTVKIADIQRTENSGKAAAENVTKVVMRRNMRVRVAALASLFACVCERVARSKLRM